MYTLNLRDNTGFSQALTFDTLQAAVGMYRSAERNYNYSFAAVYLTGDYRNPVCMFRR